MPDPWAAGPPYERFMGRWSRLVAREFLDWLAPAPALRWLDVGCGTGALSRAVLERASPASVLAVDPSRELLAHAEREIADPRIAFRVGTAAKLPEQARGVDAAVSGLVLNFAPDPVAALRSIAGAITPGGTLALYVWDYGGRMEMLQRFWEAAVALDPSARDADEALRFPLCREDALRRAFEDAGLGDVEIRPIEVDLAFASFDDYWSPFLGGQGPAPGYVAALDPEGRATLERALRSALPIRADGSLVLAARAWAARARV